MDSLINENLSRNINSKLIIETIKNLKKSFSYAEDDGIIITLDVIEEETAKDEPRVPVIKGMMNNLKEYPATETAPVSFENLL